MKNTTALCNSFGIQLQVQDFDHVYETKLFHNTRTCNDRIENAVTS